MVNGSWSGSPVSPPLENGSTPREVGRGGYSRTDVASCASVVRGPRRTIEVEEDTSSSSASRLTLGARSSSSHFCSSSSFFFLSFLLFYLLLSSRTNSVVRPGDRIFVRYKPKNFVYAVYARIPFRKIATASQYRSNARREYRKNGSSAHAHPRDRPAGLL